MSESRLDAVWAAVYVEVLSSRGGAYSHPDDFGIHRVAEACIGTKERRAIAVKAADDAVAALENEFQ